MTGARKKVYLLGEIDWIDAVLTATLQETGLAVTRAAPHDAMFVSADVVVYVYPLANHAEGLEMQASTRRAGALYLPVGVNADVVRIGPDVQPSRGGCPECLRRWQNAEWSHLRPVAVQQESSGKLPWAESFSVAAARIVAGEVVRVASGVHTASRATVRMLYSDFSSWQQHHALAHPNCPQCSDIPSDAPRVLMPLSDEPVITERGYRSGNALLDGNALTDWFVDPYFGLVKQLVQDTSSYLHSMTFAPIALDDHPGKLEYGVGRTGRRTDDSTVAMLEALERFAGFRPRGRRTAVHGSYAQLKGQALDPSIFVLHAPAQANEPGYHLTPYSEDLEFGWVWAHSFRRGGPVLIPEQLAYYHLPRGNRRFVFEISNGCAVGNSLDEAILHGLLEVIERDAYLATWYGQIPARQIDLDASDDRYVAALRAKLEGDGFEVIACDIGVGFSSPAVAAFAVDRRPGAATSLVCAAGAHLDPNKAIAGALVEVCTMLVKRTAQEAAALHERGLTLLSEPALVRTSNDHIDQCRPAQALQRMDFMLGSRPRQGGGPQWVLRSTPDSPVNLSISLQALVEEVLAVAQDILVVDQTFPDLERHALRCVKVLAPGLLPMTFGHQYRRISVPRLEQARKSCGLAIRVPGGDRWLPHTFP